MRQQSHATVRAGEAGNELAHILQGRARGVPQKWLGNWLKERSLAALGKRLVARPTKKNGKAAGRNNGLDPLNSAHAGH